MLRIALLLFPVLFFCSCLSPASNNHAYTPAGIAFIHATLVDGSGKPARTGQTLLIADGLILETGNDGEVSIPDNFQVEDLSGKTVIPGFVGMHNHLHMPGFPFLGSAGARLYLAGGVTTMQTCGAASPLQELELADKIRQGDLPGPHILTSAPYITGPGGSSSMIIPESETHLRDTMQFWLNKGVRWFKVYRHILPEDLEVVIDEAHRQGAKVTGHLCSVTFAEAVSMGIDGIEHGLNSASDFRTGKSEGECNGAREYMDQLDVTSAQVHTLFRQMIANGTFMTSTLAIYESSIPQRSAADSRTLAVMSPAMADRYQQEREPGSPDPGDSVRLRRLARIMAFEREFSRMGGILVAGTDPGRYVVPGFGDQRNFELLREAGFSVEEAIRIMTFNGAGVLGLTDRGMIRPGLRADFIILDGDLTTHDPVIREVSQVYLGGTSWDSADLLGELRGQLGLPADD